MGEAKFNKIVGRVYLTKLLLHLSCMNSELLMEQFRPENASERAGCNFSPELWTPGL